jgi:myosin heavy subunit
MFDWIVQQVNTTLAKVASNLRKDKILSIGVLDIFGFENLCPFLTKILINLTILL